MHAYSIRRNTHTYLLFSSLYMFFASFINYLEDYKKNDNVKHLGQFLYLTRLLFWR